ncbi:hypothetical protein DFH11DRAFT_1608929 [Phellopilus nigrolimitatus]|nr:hypothetical protein DFH11DRAFT_1608929 [Phellopilus nigrolimitatus]
MVFVNDKKYACETCIKGHRSSTCNHTERPLFEIKKKGRPITQCEHCRELRKTKQVHVKCLCEGKEDPDVHSHSIPAKKANRKGPVPSAAFPHGLQPTSESDEPPLPSPDQFDATQRIGEYMTCACKVGGPCECCTPRHPPRTKRSPTPPRPTIGDIRASAVTASRPPSETDDALEPLQPHALMHGHGTRPTHGSALFNPYGLAHDMHMRGHDMRGHEVIRPATPVSANESAGYVYPAPPLTYDQQRQHSPHNDQQQPQPQSQPQPFEEALPEDVDDLFAALYAPEVDIDAWLRQVTEDSNSFAPDTSAPSSANSSIPPAVPETLPVPQALDLSGDPALAEDQDYLQYNMHSGLLPQFMGMNMNVGLDVDAGEQPYLGGESDHDGNETSGLDSSAGMYDPGLLDFDSSASRVNLPDMLHAPTPFPALPALTISAFGAQSSSTTPESQMQAFDFLAALAGTAPAPESTAAVPALSRSSSTGSHASSRSRSSVGVSGMGNFNNSANSDMWHNVYEQDATSRADRWPISPPFPDTGRRWPPAHAYAHARTGGRAILPKDADALSHSFFNYQK